MDFKNRLMSLLCFRQCKTHYEGLEEDENVSLKLSRIDATSQTPIFHSCLALVKLEMKEDTHAMAASSHLTPPNVYEDLLFTTESLSKRSVELVAHQDEVKAPFGVLDNYWIMQEEDDSSSCDSDFDNATTIDTVSDVHTISSSLSSLLLNVEDCRQNDVTQSCPDFLQFPKDVSFKKKLQKKRRVSWDMTDKSTLFLENKGLDRLVEELWEIERIVRANQA